MTGHKIALDGCYKKGNNMEIVVEIPAGSCRNPKLEAESPFASYSRCWHSATRKPNGDPPRVPEGRHERCPLPRGRHRWVLEVDDGDA